MSWGFDSITEANTKIVDKRTTKQTSFNFSAGWVLQRRTVTTTTYNYLAINQDSAETILDELESDSNTIDAFFSNGESGAGTITHVLQSYGDYEDV